MALIENEAEVVLQEVVVDKDQLTHQPANFWEELSPRMAFAFGLIVAIGISSAVALIVILNVLLRGR